jgi:hypothetical protein
MEILFCGTNVKDPGRSVRVIHFPSFLLAAFHREVARYGEPNRDNVRSAAAGSEGRKILAQFNEFASSVPNMNGQVPADQIHGGFCIKDPGLKTVTIDLEGKLFIGLQCR